MLRHITEKRISNQFGPALTANPFFGNSLPPVPFRVVAAAQGTDRSAPASGDAPLPIGGLLVLPGLGVVFGPMFYVYRFVNDIPKEFWEDLQQANEALPGFLAATIVEALVDFLYVGLQIYIATRYFKRHAVVPRLMIILMLVDLGSSILSLVWCNKLLGRFDMEIFKSVFPSIVISCFWMLYFIFSKRVKRTFTVTPGSQPALEA